EVVIGGAADLQGHGLELEDVNWLADAPARGAVVWVQCRYRAAAVPATIADMGDHALRLSLAEPVRAITPGQSGVLFDGDGRVLGGGIIGRRTDGRTGGRAARPPTA
ncbi:MAG: aminomethyltransferase beta-barrel domain-containing protein, partial [Acidimicrobiales bacterium]